MKHSMVAGLILAGLLAGCSAGKDVPLAEAQIASFHRALDAGGFDAIYGGASADFKGVSTSASMVQLLSAVHRKLGAFRSGKSVSWNDNLATGGHFVTILYAAQYERGSAQESFVYRIDGDAAKLAGYHISSNALILN